MSDTTEKMVEKIEALFKNIGKTDIVEGIKACNDVMLYLEGVATNTSPEGKSVITQLLLSLELAKQMSEIANEVNEENDKIRSDLNNVMGRLKRIEEAKGFDDSEKMR